MIKLGILLFVIVLLILFVLIVIYMGNDKSFTNTISGIILLEEEPIFNSATIQRELELRYKLRINKKTANDGIVIFSSDKYRIVIVAVDAEIPEDELESVCKISHLWKDAKEETSKHKSHLILTVSSDITDLVELNMQFTRIAASILRNTKSLGIYLGNQSLIAPREYYVKIADTMSNDDLPLPNWIYFGLRENNSKRNGFTIGLKEFGFREIEFTESEKSFEEIYKVLYDLAHHVLLSRQPLKQGETFDLSEKEKISMESRASEFRDTESMQVVVMENLKNPSKIRD
jgi:hypothetical protein